MNEDMATPQEKPGEPRGDRTPAFVYATTRDWPGYFEVTKGRPPRETLLEALDRFDPELGDQPRFGVDLGCGEGRDSAEMLRRGWHVLAIDGHPDAICRLVHRDDLTDPQRLTMRLASFESVELPRCDLLNASFSLPFCHPDHFDALWARIIASINPGGRFAGQFFGDRDEWATIPDRSHHTREQVERLLAPFRVELLKEEERDGQDCSGTSKHWHAFHVVASMPEHGKGLI